MQLRGRQTQFYIDLIYGFGFAAGFGYLLFVGMDPRIAAFQGGLVFGYFLRVWEKMTVYERVLHEEVAAEAESVVAEEAEMAVAEEAEEAVAAEAHQAVLKEAEEAVAEEVEDTVQEAVAEEAEEAVGAEMDERFDDEFDERISDEVEEQIDDQRALPSPRQRRRDGAEDE